MKVLFDYMFSNPSTPMYTFDYCATANETCGVDIEVFKREVLFNWGLLFGAIAFNTNSRHLFFQVTPTTLQPVHVERGIYG